MTDHQTAVDPKTALAGASKLTTAGERLLTRWRSLRAQIEHLNSRAPWGKDEVGNEFNKNYLQDGDKAPAHNVLDVGESLVKAIGAVGPQVTEGVQGTLDVDELTSTWFGKK